MSGIRGIGTFGPPLLAGHRATAIVLDLVQPLAARRPVYRYWLEGTAHEPARCCNTLAKHSRPDRWNRPFRDGHHGGQSHGARLAATSARSLVKIPPVPILRPRSLRKHSLASFMPPRYTSWICAAECHRGLT